jgi:membrane protein
VTPLLTKARGLLEGSVVQEFGTRLSALDFGTWIVFFGASVMFSVLPLIILLSAFANHQIDGDISRHLGLNNRGAAVIRGLFHYSSQRPASGIALAIIIGFAGAMVIASSLQTIYERVLGYEHRGWRDGPRFVLWIVVLLGVLTAQAVLSRLVRANAGLVVQVVFRFAAATAFFGWSVHFLLGGRTPWRRVVRPAIVTALAWLGLALFSSIYFSSSVVSDSRLYGTIGAVFSLLAWFIAVGAVVVLGAVVGEIWQQRAERRVGRSD